ncbi:lysozyme [Azospirillum fermentarium]|uniref:glycoside hydrolase family protein n=1 Tax=Azospirillum fermentarium TaxID=1233114 RepID=UPI0022261B68|nr:glycoside hydrolase family protein [Azospirillum fermentarium]MCW2248313.1 lysozyme [Azospirillum fermentarium]
MNLDQLKADLIRDEDLKLRAYTCTAGKTTVGVGRNLDDVGISRDEALYLLDNDIRRVTADLNREFPWWRRLSEPRQRAVANMCFNMGINRLKGFRKMLAALQAGDYGRAAAEATDSAWFRQVGVRGPRVVALIRNG